MQITLPLVMRVPFLARVDNPRTRLRSNRNTPLRLAAHGGVAMGPFPDFRFFLALFSRLFSFLPIAYRTKTQEMLSH
jgi:hypothetical protein